MKDGLKLEAQHPVGYWMLRETISQHFDHAERDQA